MEQVFGYVIWTVYCGNLHDSSRLRINISRQSILPVSITPTYIHKSNLWSGCKIPRRSDPAFNCRASYISRPEARAWYIWYITKSQLMINARNRLQETGVDMVSATHYFWGCLPYATSSWKPPPQDIFPGLANHLFLSSRLFMVCINMW
jgi:hypothetical protein